MCLNANPDLFQESHKDLFVEINRLSLSIHQIREEAKRFFQNNFTTDFKALLLKSYLNSSINIVEDIAFLLKRSRRSSLEGMARMFFESYAEYYQIASKYCFDTEIEKEINYVYFREIDNQRCAYERIKKSAASSDLDDVKGSLKQDIKLLIQKRFANELSSLKEETDDAFLESIKVVLQRIKNNSALIDNKRISLEKQSRLVMTAINAKSLYAVHDAIRFFVSKKPDAVVLDFFAGSGTTMHAVNLLNEEDGGQRRCILVTNNEIGM